MHYPNRFAGYDSPGMVLDDSALTREQKISALQSWRSAVRRFASDEAGTPKQQVLLIAEIDRALDAVQAGH